MMIGTVPGGVGSPTVDEGRAPRTAGEVAVGDRLGKDIGDRFRMGAQDLKVVGIVDGISLFGGMPNVWLTMDDVQALTFGGAPLYTVVAIRGHPSETPEGLKVASVSETTTDLLQSLGSGQQTIDFLAILLWIIAACIVGSVIYLSALERVRDFAVFKATGTSTPALPSGLALQAVIVSLVAALFGAIFALVLAPNFPMPAEIPRRVRDPPDRRDHRRRAGQPRRPAPRGDRQSRARVRRCVMPALSIEDLVVEYSSGGYAVRPIDGLSVTMEPGELGCCSGRAAAARRRCSRASAGSSRRPRGRSASATPRSPGSRVGR